MGYIYKITNILDRKCYIGITTKNNPEDRWKSHKSSIKCGKRYCPILGAAVKKYGEESFKFEVLIICFDEDLFKFERDYIKKYNSVTPNGYNVHEGGECGGNFVGKKHSEETKIKLSIESKEYNNREDVKEAARKRTIEFNKTHNIGDLQRQSAKWQKAKEEGRIGGKGRTRINIQNNSEEINQKVSKTLKIYFQNNRDKHKEIMTKAIGRKVNQYTLENELINTFDSISLASRNTGIGRRSIQANVSGHTRTSGGYIWKYAS